MPQKIRPNLSVKVPERPETTTSTLELPSGAVRFDQGSGHSSTYLLEQGGEKFRVKECKLKPNKQSTPEPTTKVELFFHKIQRMVLPSELTTSYPSAIAVDENHFGLEYKEKAQNLTDYIKNNTGEGREALPGLATAMLLKSLFHDKDDKLDNYLVYESNGKQVAIGIDAEQMFQGFPVPLNRLDKKSLIYELNCTGEEKKALHTLVDESELSKALGIISISKDAIVKESQILNSDMKETTTEIVESVATFTEGKYRDSSSAKLSLTHRVIVQEMEMRGITKSPSEEIIPATPAKNEPMPVRRQSFTGLVEEKKSPQVSRGRSPTL